MQHHNGPFSTPRPHLLTSSWLTSAIKGTQALPAAVNSLLDHRQTRMEAEHRQQQSFQLCEVHIEGGAALLSFLNTDGLRYVLYSQLRSVHLPHVAQSTLQRRKRELLGASPAGEQHSSKCPAAYLELYKRAGLLKTDARQADVLTVQQATALLQDLRQRGRASRPPPVATSSDSAGTDQEVGIDTLCQHNFEHNTCRYIGNLMCRQHSGNRFPMV